jgi:hypothetical protein
MSQPEQPDLLTVSQLSSKLQVKRSWVYSHADQLGAFRVGKYLRFSWTRVCDRLTPLAEPTPAALPNGQVVKPCKALVK